MSKSAECAFLKDAMSKIIPFAAKRSRIPILEQVRIIARTDEIELTTTDVDNTARISIPAFGAGSWETCVRAHDFFDAVKAQSADTVTMDYSGDKDGRFTFGNRTMPTLPAADFPDYGPTAESEGRITVPFSTYRNIWRKTGFAIPTEETRYYPNGIYIHQESGAFRAVTSDGHRLAIYNFHANSAGNWPASIVPRFLCQTLARNIGKKGDGAYEIEHYGNGVMIREVQDKSMYGALNVWARLVDGTFPDYVRVIPTDFFGAVTYAKSALESALGAVKISKEKAQAVAVDIIGADTILSAQSAEGDKARADLRHTGDSHIDFRIGFNASYVGALLSAFDGESVTMRIGGTYVKGTKVKAPCNDSAVLWESPNDPGFSVVLMPMRIGKRPEKETAEAVTVPDGGANLAEAHQSKVTEGEMK